MTYKVPECRKPLEIRSSFFADDHPNSEHFDKVQLTIHMLQFAEYSGSWKRLKRFV